MPATAPSVLEIAQAIVAREGGFVNDPDDPGGATKHGVTLGTLRALGLDLDGDGRVGIADVARLGPGQAADIYIEHYFNRPGLGRLPVELHAAVFDMQVNAGAAAVRLLQRVLTVMGYALVEDGEIGPRTAEAARAACLWRPERLVDAYGAERREYYYRLGDARPTSRKYCRRRDGGKGGWILRAEEFMSPPARLSDAQHRARVASWA